MTCFLHVAFFNFRTSISFKCCWAKKSWNNQWIPVIRGQTTIDWNYKALFFSWTLWSDMLNFKFYSHYVHLIVTSSTDSIFPPCQDGHGRGTGLSDCHKVCCWMNWWMPRRKWQDLFVLSGKLSWLNCQRLSQFDRIFPMRYVVDSSDDLSNMLLLHSYWFICIQ